MTCNQVTTPRTCTRPRVQRCEMPTRAPGWMFHALCSPVYAIGVRTLLSNALERICQSRNSRFSSYVTLESPEKRERAATHFLKAVAYLTSFITLVWYHVYSEDSKTFGGVFRLHADPSTVTDTHGLFRDVSPPTVLAPLCLYATYVVDLARSKVTVVTLLHHLASVYCISLTVVGGRFESETDAKLYDEFVIGAMTMLSANCVPYAIFAYYHLGHSIYVKRILIGYLHYVHTVFTVWMYHLLTIMFIVRKLVPLMKSKVNVVISLTAYLALLMDHVSTLSVIKKMYRSLLKKETLSAKSVGMWLRVLDMSDKNDVYPNLEAVQKAAKKWRKETRKKKTYEACVY